MKKTQITVRIDAKLYNELVKFQKKNAYATQQDMFEDMIKLHIGQTIERIERQLVRCVVIRVKNPRP